MAKTLDDVLGGESAKQVIDNNNNSQSNCNSNNNSHRPRRGIKRKYESLEEHDSEESFLENKSDEKVEEDEGPSERNPSECQVNKPTGGKYQLRPRSHHPRRLSDSEWNFSDAIGDKPRPPPLSRYRRKTANARERYRMKQINSAFENLRGVLPSWACSRRPPSDMTKIATLKLAAAYIRSLQDILDGKNPNDTCSWILSALLEEEDSDKTKDLTDTQTTTNVQKCELSVSTDEDPESDLVSLLCSSSNSTVGVSQESLEAFSYLTPMAESEAMALLLGCDPPPWNDSQTVSLV